MLDLGDDLKPSRVLRRVSSARLTDFCASLPPASNVFEPNDRAKTPRVGKIPDEKIYCNMD